jgi:hypothetical protein
MSSSLKSIHPSNQTLGGMTPSPIIGMTPSHPLLTLNQTHPKSNMRWDGLIPDIRDDRVLSLVDAQPNTPYVYNYYL